MGYEEIVFVQGEDADEILDVINNVGDEDALEAAVRDYGHLDPRVSAGPSWTPPNAFVIEDDDYILQYNLNHVWWSLYRKVAI